MPTRTFLRLPEEKQLRFIDAAWAEFTRTRYVDTSINNIIKGAGVSRGSFYQYFADKDELFAYLLEQSRIYFTQDYLQRLSEVGGDLFQVQLSAFDCFTRPGHSGHANVDRLLRVLRINPGFDLQKMFSPPPGPLTDPLLRIMDVSMLRQTDRAYVQRVFCLTIMVLAKAIMESLLDPASIGAYRQELELQLEIIRRGSVKNQDTTA